jgi:hypothetical protein
MSLADLIDNSKTDKNTTHSYLESYEAILNRKKFTAKLVLEVGIGDFGEKNGGSLKLWHDYFPNAVIHGLDILGEDRIMDELLHNNRVVLHTLTDAYNEDFFNRTFLDKNMKFDVLVDDGPHTLESMSIFIKLYSQLLSDDGILIVEDVPATEWVDALYNTVPDHLKQYVRVFDLRHIKGRFDDILFVIDKR